MTLYLQRTAAWGEAEDVRSLVQRLERIGGGQPAERAEDDGDLRAAMQAFGISDDWLAERNAQHEAASA